MILFVSHVAGAFLLSSVCALPLGPSLGIMAILFSGIVMSHYTHHNLSPVTQILMQQTLRTVAFLCGESCPGAVPRSMPPAPPHPGSGSRGFSRPGEAAEFLRARYCTPLSFVTLAFRFHNVNLTFHNVNLTPQSFLEHLMPTDLRLKITRHLCL